MGWGLRRVFIVIFTCFPKIDRIWYIASTLQPLGSANLCWLGIFRRCCRLAVPSKKRLDKLQDFSRHGGGGASATQQQTNTHPPRSSATATPWAKQSPLPKSACVAYGLPCFQQREGPTSACVTKKKTCFSTFLIEAVTPSAAVCLAAPARPPLHRTTCTKYVYTTLRSPKPLFSFFICKSPVIEALTPSAAACPRCAPYTLLPPRACRNPFLFSRKVT